MGLSVIGLAAYFYFAPVYLIKPEGGVFNCGSAASPNTDATNICGAPEGLNQARALAALGIGVMVIVLGFALFGLRRDRNDAAASEWDDDIDLRDGRDERAREHDDDRPRGRRSDDVDLRVDTRDDDVDRGRSDGLRGVDRRRDRDLDDRDRDRDMGGDTDLEIDDSRATHRRSGGRRSALRDDDFADPSPRRRADDDWSSDGWR